MAKRNTRPEITNTKLSHGVELNAFQRMQAAVVTARANATAYPEPDAAENVDAWIVWAWAKLQAHGKARGLNTYVVSQIVRTIESTARSEEDVAANCDFKMWLTRFDAQIDFREKSRLDMERANADRKAKQDAERTFRPSPLSDRVRIWLMKPPYNLSSETAEALFVKSYKLAPKPPVEDPRHWLAVVTMNAEHETFNHEGQNNKHWFATPGQGVQFLKDYYSLCFKRGVEFEQRMNLLCRALGVKETPFEYPKSEANATAVYIGLIDLMFPAIESQFNGFMPDTEAASLISIPHGMLTEENLIQGVSTMTDQPVIATHWTETKANSAFWGQVATDLKLMPSSERSPFVHRAIKDKWGYTSIKQTASPEEARAAYLEMLQVPGGDELTAPQNKAAEAPKTDEALQPPPRAAQNQMVAKSDRQEEVEEDDFEIVPGKTVSDYLLGAKTITGVEAIEIVKWLNMPHANRFYKGVPNAPKGQEWTDLDPYAVRRRLDKVFGVQGMGWKITASASSRTETIPTQYQNREGWLVIMTDYVFSYKLLLANGAADWVEVGGIGASDAKSVHKWAMHGANTGLMKRALSVMGGFAHFTNPDGED